MRKTVLFLFIITLCAQSFGQKDKTDYDLLWRLEKDNRVSYLFGTMHVKDERAFQFSDSVMLAIEASESFALEMHPDSLFKLFDADFKKDLDSPKDLLTHEEFQKLKKKFKEQTGSNYENFDINNTLTLTEILSKESKQSPQRKTFVDAYLLGIAKTLKKNIHGLEKLEDQLKPYDDQENSRKELLQFIEEENTLTTSYDKFVSAYSTGSLKSIIPFTGMMEEDEIMTRRNETMANTISQIHEKSTLFSAIGAAHLIGNNSVPKILEKLGFKINRVSASFTGIADTFNIDPMKMQWHTYANRKTGYQIETPGPMIAGKGESFELIDMHVMMDLTGNSSFFTFNLDMRLIPEKSEKEIQKKFFKNFVHKQDKKTVSTFTKNGLKFNEMLVVSEDGSKGRMQYTIKDEILFCHAVFGFFENQLPEHNRFFNSFSFIQKEAKETNSSKWVQHEAAFEIAFDNEPRYIEKLTPVEIEGDYVEVKSHTYSEIDADIGLLKMVAYNDLSPGYYVDSPEDQMQEILNELALKSSIGQIDTLKIQGYDALKIDIKVERKYPGKMLILYKGNRSYSVLEMAVNEEQNSDLFGAFIDSFFLRENASASFENIVFDTLDFSLNLFNPNFKIDRLSFGNEDIFDSVEVVSFQNQMSGGHYMLQKCFLKEYAYFKHEDSLLSQLMESSLQWYDSITQIKFEKNDFSNVQHIIYEDLYANNQGHLTSWFDGEFWYLLQAVNENEAQVEEYMQKIASSFKPLKKRPKPSFGQSKAELIVKDLQHTDSLVVQKAKGSFAYYYWQTEELTHLNKLLNRSFTDDNKKDGVKAKIIDEIDFSQDSASYYSLLEAYPNFTALLKEKTLAVLYAFENQPGLEEYLKLLKEDPPLRSKSDTFSFFQAFRDSTELVEEHFETLMSLSKKGAYKKEIIGLLNKHLIKHPAFENWVQKEMHHLTLDAIADFEKYTKLSVDERNYNLDLLIPYLEISERVKHSFAGPYVNLLSTIEDVWVQNEALETKIYNGLGIKKKELKKALKNDFTRYEILEVSQRANKLNKIDTKYLNHKTLAKTVLIEFLDYDGYRADDFEFLGQLRQGEEFYFCFEMGFEYDQSKYLGIAGPFKTGELPSLNALNAYTDWQDIKDNWREQALETLPDMKKFGLQTYY